MAKKPTKYELISVKGKTRVFEYSVALTLLTKYKTWSLPEESEFEFIDNDIRRKSSTGDVSES